MATSVIVVTEQKTQSTSYLDRTLAHEIIVKIGTNSFFKEIFKKEIE